MSASLATWTFAATKESASQTTPKTALHVNVTKATQEHGAVSYKRPIPWVSSNMKTGLKTKDSNHLCIKCDLKLFIYLLASYYSEVVFYSFLY